MAGMRGFLPSKFGIVSGYRYGRVRKAKKNKKCAKGRIVNGYRRLKECRGKILLVPKFMNSI